MLKSIFILFTIGFVAIRMRFHAPELDGQTEVKPLREKVLATQFSLCLLVTHGWWLSQNAIPSFTIWSALGMVLMGMSIPLLYWVHHSLGQYFSARLVLQPEHTIIQTGPYRWVRHPMYSVGFLYLIGAGLLSQAWIVGIVPTLSFGLLVWLRIRDEEAMLSEVSKEYMIYMKNTGRFFPRMK